MYFLALECVLMNAVRDFLSFIFFCVVSPLSRFGFIFKISVNISSIFETQIQRFWGVYLLGTVSEINVIVSNSFTYESVSTFIEKNAAKLQSFTKCAKLQMFWSRIAMKFIFFFKYCKFSHFERKKKAIRRLKVMRACAYFFYLSYFFYFSFRIKKSWGS